VGQPDERRSAEPSLARRLLGGACGGLAAGLCAGAWGGLAAGGLRAGAEMYLQEGMPWSVLEAFSSGASSWAAVLGAAGLLLGASFALLSRFLKRLSGKTGTRTWDLLSGGACLGIAAVFVLGGWKTDLFPLLRYTPRLTGNAFAAAQAAACAWLVWYLARRASRQPGAAPRRALIALLAVGAGVPVCLQAAVASRHVLAARPGLNILLVSIDTLRADRMGIYGYGRPTSPNLDRIASEGIVFDDATTTAPWTLPAHMSLMTGLHPGEHGCERYFTRLAPGAVTLAERLREAGYRCAAFTGGGYVAARFGFADGFEKFVEVREDDDPLGAGRIAREVIAWLDRSQRQPFFLFVHTYAPHVPYLHPDFATPEGKALFPDGVRWPWVEKLHKGLVPADAAARQAVSDYYDGDVREADGAVGGILDHMRRSGILEQTLVVILSDHGEELWNHFPPLSADHGHSFFQEVLRIPLIIRMPGGVPAGSRIAAPVSILDVPKTILHVAGIPAPEGFRGRSLVDLMEGRDAAPDVEVFAESAEYGPERKVIRSGTLKLIHAPDPTRLVRDTDIGPVPRLALYDLSSDPAELHDLSVENPEVVEGLMRRLGSHLSSQRRPFIRMPRRQQPAESPASEQMRALGYLR